jgi:hypothetical protein
MQKDMSLTRLLAISGTALVSLPLLVGVLAAVLGYVTRGVLAFDLLLPVELFPPAVVGALLLLWAARRAHDRCCLIAWAEGAAAVTLLLLLLFPSDLRDAWLVLLPLAALLTVEMAVTGVGGLLLVHDILSQSAPHA